jgi:hypothetical protein
MGWQADIRAAGRGRKDFSAEWSDPYRGQDFRISDPNKNAKARRREDRRKLGHLNESRPAFASLPLCV